ncbi:MAG: hypothetical protein MK212_11025 [Saprospiraceae bacterium]|nr:hypothetical protein [Saprospiraceae bacterium]
MKPFLSLFLLLLTTQCILVAQDQIPKIEMLTFDVASIPAQIEFKGDIITGKHWKDANGENYVILTRSKDLIKTLENGAISKSALVSAVHYARQQDGAFRLIRKLNDFVKNCTENTMIADHIENSLSITDLDGNAKAEIVFLYKTACGSDETVVPNVHLVLLENGEKYPMRGNMSYEMTGRGEAVSMQIGNQSVGAEFDNAPEAFLEHAKKQWKQFAVEQR